MSEKPTIQLTEKEQAIISDILDAAALATKKHGTQIQICSVIGETEVRAIKPALDLFQLIDNGKTDAIERVTGEDGDAVIAAYKLPGIGEKYFAEDIYSLKYRLQGFLKDTVAQSRQCPRILYIADCHFYHDRICHEMDKRGFSGFEEMNDHMISQWNAKVTPRDDVYILGDLSISKPDATIRILERLNGKLHLIVGNHDRYIEDKNYSWDSWFKSIENYQEIRDNGRNVILLHYPVFCYKGQYRRDKDGKSFVYMLYGHVHNTHDEELINSFIMQTRNTRVLSRHSVEPEPIPCNMINCFCMFSDYQPMTLDEWIEIDRKRREKM